MRRSAAVAALLALAACGKRSGESEPTPPGDAGAPARDAAAARPDRAVLDEVEVAAIEGPGQPHRKLPDLARALATTLVTSGRFAADDAAVPATHRPRRARVDVLVGVTLVPNEQKVWVVVAVAEGQVTWVDGGQDPAPQEKVLIERPLGKRKPTAEQWAAEAAEASSTAAKKIASGLIAKEAVRSGPPDKLRAALSGADDGLRLWALSLIRERIVRAGVDDVARLLASPDADVRERALGALLTIGDPRAAGAIADHARTDDLPFLRNAIDAVAALGGADAIDWLEFLATGHSEDDIREQAQRALDRLRVRRTPPR